MFRIGDLIDNTYRLMEEIGRGGTGTIYKAYHLRLKKNVVLKKMDRQYSSFVNDRAEVDLLKRLHHSYLPQVYDFLQYGSEVFTVMEYVDGFSLEEALNRNEKFNEETVVKWLKELLDVLDYLHSQKPSIFHNDIKPGNIMITRDGHACLIDFNISLDETEANKIVGLSERYASPEQKEKANLARQHLYHENIKIDTKSDIYSLGVTFLYLIKEGKYSESLNNVLLKATCINKNERFKSAKHMLKAVENLSYYDSRYFRYRFIAIIGRSVYVIILIFAIFFIWGGYCIKTKESFEEERKALNSLKIQCAYDQVVEKGIILLNDISYTMIYSQSPEEKAAVLNAVAEGYYGKCNYNEAINYYEEALKLDNFEEEKSSYLKNCAIAYAKSGNISEAEELLSLAKGVAKDSSDIEIIIGEIAYSNNKKKVALESFEKAKEKSKTLESRIDALRRAGRLYSENKSFQKAAEYYEEIIKTNYGTFEDQINLAINYEFLKNFEKSEKILKTLLVDYPDDYRIYMCLTRIAIGIKDKEKALENYVKAKEYYKDNPKMERDANMEKLIKEMEKS